MKVTLRVTSAAMARPIMITPAQKPMPTSRRTETAPIVGRSASIGVIRLALTAGSSPASSVTPTPMTMLTMTSTGEMTGAPILIFNIRPSSGVRAKEASKPSP